MTKLYNSSAIKLALKNYFAQIILLKIHSFPALILPGIGMILIMYVPTLIVAKIITKLNGDQISLESVLPYVIMLGVIWLIGELIWRLAIHLLNKNDSKGIENLFNNGLEELLGKDIGFFHNNFSGSLTKKLIGYSKNYELFCDTLAFNISANILPLIFTIVVLWILSPWLVLVLLGLMSIVVSIIIPLIRRRQKLVADREVASNLVAGHIADVIGNIDAVQSFANERYEFEHHKKLVADYAKKSKKSWDYHNLKIDLAISPLYVLINVTGLAIAISLGENATQAAAIFITFNYYSYVTRILWDFNRIYRNLESSITDAAQFTELLIDSPELKSPENKNQLKINQGNIVFDNVNFKYIDGNDLLFSKLNLTIKSGEKIALVGHSGSGKTTVTKLLLRFKELSGGKIIIDGQNISEYSLASIRSSIAYVPQEPIMFHRTIADNIKYGSLKASHADIVEAAKNANAHEFIEKLPNGYSTLVGERGVKLSGGQRQRIAIARAIIKKSKIIILDEATSALDSFSEGLIQEALWKLMQNRTAIVIAHRLSTIKNMDRIIVLDNGKIIEEGSHDELISMNGKYKKLWEHQSGGFIKD